MPQETADLVTFTEEILTRKLYFFKQSLFRSSRAELFWEIDDLGILSNNIKLLEIYIKLLVISCEGNNFE